MSLSNPSPHDEQVFRYLRPMAERALTVWYAERYTELDEWLRKALCNDICSIMIEEGILPSNGYRPETAVMVLDLRIYPADLRSYAECIS